MCSYVKLCYKKVSKSVRRVPNINDLQFHNDTNIAFFSESPNSLKKAIFVLFFMSKTIYFPSIQEITASSLGKVCGEITFSNSPFSFTKYF